MQPRTASTFDRFGFVLPSLAREETGAREVAMTSEVARNRCWTSSDISSYAPKKLKQLVRDGVPAQLRPAVWLQLSGGDFLRKQYNADYYDSLISRSPTNAAMLDVEATILRQMPAHKFLSQGAGIRAVLSIVRAFERHVPSSPRHNISCIAAFLVSVLGLNREADCFWIMVGLLEHKLSTTAVQQESTEGVLLEQCMLEAQLHKRCPKLLQYLTAMDVSLPDLTRGWFGQLFCGALPAETTVRVWDCLMNEGAKVPLRVAIALLKREEGIIVGNLQKIRTTQWRVSRTYNADALLKLAFRGIGSLSTAEVVACRRAVEANLVANRSGQVKRLEALLCPPRISPQPSTSSAMSDLSTILEVSDASAVEVSSIPKDRIELK